MTIPTLVVLGLACLAGAGVLAALVILLKRAAFDAFGDALDGVAREMR